MTENINEKIRAFLHRNAGYLVVLLVSAAYVAMAVLGLDESGKSVIRIIGDGAIAFMVGLSINLVLGLQGMMNGERDESFIETIRLHGQTVERVTPKIDELDAWCDRKNRENLKQQRMRILAEEGLKYDTYFDEEGGAKDFDYRCSKNKREKKAEKRRYKCYRRAVALKLTPLSAGELTSEGCKTLDPYDFGRTKEEYERQTGLRELLSKFLTAAVFGYYSVKLIGDFSYDKLIYNLLQVAVFVIAGTIKMYNSYLFMTGEYRGRVVKKINSLEMFYNDVTEENK